MEWIGHPPGRFHFCLRPRAVGRTERCFVRAPSQRASREGDGFTRPVKALTCRRRPLRRSSAPWISRAAPRRAARARARQMPLRYRRAPRVPSRREARAQGARSRRTRPSPRWRRGPPYPRTTGIATTSGGPPRARRRPPPADAAPTDSKPSPHPKMATTISTTIVRPAGRAPSTPPRRTCSTPRPPRHPPGATPGSHPRWDATPTSG